jgi:hypothetical protein
MSKKASFKKIAGLIVVTILLFIYSQYIAPNLDSPDVDSADVDAGTTDNASGKSSVRDGADSKSASKKGLSRADQNLLGQLKERAAGEMVSTAGLRYTRGSQEGHRLKHIQRHDNDMPSREGSHGVFAGDEAKMLAIIDEAYLLVKDKDRAASIRRDGSRSICTVNLKRNIGFLGGTAGKRRENPQLQRVRLILENDRLITAYPVER